MTVPEMRIAIAKVYPGGTWVGRVGKMKENQVKAIYFRFRRTGRV